MQQNNFSYKTGKKEFVTRKNEKLSPAAFIIPTFFIYIVFVRVVLYDF